MLRTIGCELSRAVAPQVYEQADSGPMDVDVVELHDGFTVNAVPSDEALGLYGESETGCIIVDGDNICSGRYGVNPSSGLLWKAIRSAPPVGRSAPNCHAAARA